MSDQQQTQENAQEYWTEHAALTQRHARMPLKTLAHAAVQEVIAEEAQDDDTYNPYFAIRALQNRSTRETLAYMMDLLYSADAHERAVGARVLGQMRSESGDYHAFQDEAVAALIQALDLWRADPATLESLAYALGHRDDARAIRPLITLKAHPDAQVRRAVVHGLWGLDEPLAIATLSELITDSDTKVRDWATFAFNLIEADTPEVREALFARTQDGDLDVRSEAIEALATRHDPRAVPAALAAIADGANGLPIMNAAIALADPALYPALVLLYENCDGWYVTTHEEALIACAPEEIKKWMAKTSES